MNTCLRRKSSNFRKVERQAIRKVKFVCKDPKTLDLAIKEIEISFTTACNYLNKIYLLGYRVNKDLSRNNELYDSYENYRLFANHFRHHFWFIKKIPLIPFSSR